MIPMIACACALFFSEVDGITICLKCEKLWLEASLKNSVIHHNPELGNDSMSYINSMNNTHTSTPEPA